MGVTLKTDTARRSVCTGLSGANVSVDLSQILASRAPSEEIVRAGPYEDRSDPATLFLDSPLCTTTLTHSRYFCILRFEASLQSLVH
jgi:hypothetical protein